MGYDGSVLMTNDAAMSTGGTWYINDFAKNAPDVEVRYIKIPHAEGHEDASGTFHAPAYAILKGGAHEKETAMAINYLMNLESRAEPRPGNRFPGITILTQWRNAEMKKWKVALIGCGSIADNTYLPRIGEIPEADLVAVCDIIPERAKNYAEKFHVPAWYTSIDELLEKCDFEILMNTTSIPAHHEINMKALRAGKHLYSQKPVGLTVEEVTEQIEAAKAAGVKYTASPIHMLRDDIRFAKKLIADGCIGEIMKVHTNVCHGGPEYFQYRTADPTWFHRPGSGALYDMGVHGLTMTTGILGPAKAVGCMAKISEPVRTVRTGTFDGMQIQADQLYDNYIITLDYGERTMAVVESGFCQKDSRAPQMEIFGTKGTITFVNNGNMNPLDSLEVYLDAPERGIRGWLKPMEWDVPASEMNFFQCKVVQDLIHAIEEDRPVGLPPEHARHVVDIMCTIPEAIKTKSIVPLHTTF